MKSALDLLVIHPWADAEWRLQLGWLRALSEAVGELRPNAGRGGSSLPHGRMDTFALPPARGDARRSVSHMVDAGHALSQTVRGAFYRRVTPTHLLCLEVHIDILVALGEILAGFPVLDGVFVIDLSLEGWLAATSPFGLEAVAHLTEVLNSGGASVVLFACRNLAQEELGRSVQLPLIRLPDLPLTVPVLRSPPPSWAVLGEPIAKTVRSLADSLDLYTDGLIDPIRLSILIDALARVYDFPLEWRQELAAAENRWLTLVELDPAPTPPLDAIPDLVRRLASLGMPLRDGVPGAAKFAGSFHAERF